MSGCEKVCAVVAVASFVFSIALSPIAAILVLVFYYVGGVGVRERSRYAAVMVLVMFAIDMLVGGVSVVRVLLLALLLSNVRATWKASRWQPDSEDAALTPRLGDTWTDKLADWLPMWLWPKVRYLYYVFSACVFVLSLVGVLYRSLR